MPMTQVWIREEKEMATGCRTCRSAFPTAPRVNYVPGAIGIFIELMMTTWTSSTVESSWATAGSRVFSTSLHRAGGPRGW